MRLEETGYDLMEARISESLSDQLRNSVFQACGAGERCLLDHPAVVQAARQLIDQLVDEVGISKTAVAIQAIAFDKSQKANWKETKRGDSHILLPFWREGRLWTCGLAV